MLDKIKQYAKGVAAAVGLAGTVATLALPVDSAGHLWAEIGVAVATLVAVVSVPNKTPADKLAAADTAAHEIGTAVVRIRPDLSGFVAEIESVLDGIRAKVAVTPVLSDTVTHVDPVVAADPAPVVDGEGDVLGSVPADPSPVVADGDPAAAIPDPPVAPVDPPADVLPPVEAEAPAAPADPAPAAGLDDGVSLPDDVPPPTVGILTS